MFAVVCEQSYTDDANNNGSGSRGALVNAEAAGSDKFAGKLGVNTHIRPKDNIPISISFCL